MAKQAIEITVAAVLSLLLSPLFLIAALGIHFSSSGPVLYRSKRVGRNGEIFVMHKFRTMHVDHGAHSSVITGSRDPRVFWFGALLRKLKIDELPQLFDVLRGKMSLVGPRPEDPRIVELHYTDEYRKTLSVRPGLASPGSIFNYTHGEELLAGDDPEASYVERLLPLKMALELVYLQRASLWYDLRVVLRTLYVIAAITLGKRQFREPPEAVIARQQGKL